jgi:hypothetical protein
MEDFLYSYNQPKKFGKYDLFLDGKVTVNELVYKILTEEGEYQNIDIAEKVKEIEGRLQTHFTFEHVDELPTEGKETVIYLVPNEDNSGDKDSYNEYMWDETNKKFELIGSGTYAQQKAELEAETDRAKEAEKTLTNNLAQEVSDRKSADSTLDGKISTENLRATKAEGELSSQIGGLSTRIKTIEDYDIDNRAKELKTRVDTLDNQNLNTRIKALEDLNLSSVIELVNQLQSKIAELEETVEELKAYHPVEDPTDPETPTEPTE